MRLLKVATVVLSVFAVVGISVKIASADQTPIGTPTPGIAVEVPIFTEGDYKYTILNADAKTCEIIEYIGSREDVHIPVRLNGYSVKTIAGWAFSDKDTMKSVEIPLSVDKIGAFAFGYCDELKTVMLLNKDAEIHQNAFGQSKNIKTFVYTGTYADGKALVDSLNLPENVTIQLLAYPSPTMSITAVPQPTGAEEINTPTPTTDPTDFTEDDCKCKILDDDAKTCEIIEYTGSKEFVHISERLNGYSVKTIGGWAFAKNEKMKNVEIPLSVEKIEAFAFGYCNKLEMVMLLNKNAEVHKNAFAQSKNIKTFVYTGTYADGKALVDSLNLPEGVKVELLSYPSPTMSITAVPQPTTAEDTSTPTPEPTIIISATPAAPTVTEAAQPTIIVSATPTNTVAPTVTAEPTIIISATPAATATGTPTPTATETPVIIISATPAVADPTTAPATAKVSGSTYKIKGNKIEITAVSKKATKVVIPSTVKVNGKKYKVTSVSASAFKQAKKLKSVTIGKNIVSIAKNAFKGKADLAKIIVKSSGLKSIGKGAFSGIAKDVTVFIPKKYEKSYKKLFNKAIKSKITYKVV